MLAWLPNWAIAAAALALAPVLAFGSYEAARAVIEARTVTVMVPGPVRVVTVRPGPHHRHPAVTPVAPGAIVGPAAASPVQPQRAAPHGGRGRTPLPVPTPGSAAPAPGPVSSSPTATPGPAGTTTGPPSPAATSPVPPVPTDTTVPPAPQDTADTSP